MQSLDIADMSLDMAELSIEEVDEQSMLDDIEVPIASEELDDDWARPGTAAAAKAPATRSAPIIESSFFISASV
jgi:hypothetical protein